MQRQTIAYLIWFMFSFSAIANTWTKLESGIDYQDLNTISLTPWSHIHVFRIDLKKVKLDLVMAKKFNVHNRAVNNPSSPFLSPKTYSQNLNNQKSLAFVDEIAKQHNALIAVNGGFFDRDNQPLGLRISHNQQIHALKQISWWGVFYIKKNMPFITSLSNYHSDPNIETALQVGPRLIINGYIPHLKPGFSERSALGITPTGKLILVVTENTPITTTDLAHLLKAPPLKCINALNLDGGSSSQLYANLGLFHINHSGFAPVSDAIILRALAK